MLQKILILKAVDFLLDLLREVVEDTDNKLDDRVLDTVTEVKEVVEKVL